MDNQPTPNPCDHRHSGEFTSGGEVKIAEAGGIEAIVEGMGRHKEHAGVQEQGCGALANLGMVKQENDIKIRIVRSSYDGFVLKKIFCPLL
jgi:hypothetical protein